MQSRQIRPSEVVVNVKKQRT